MTRSTPVAAAHRAARRRGGSPADLVIVAGLGGAVGYAALQQGGFYRSQLVTVVGLVAVAALGRAARPRRPVPPALAVAAGALTLFAAWTLVRAGDLAAAAPAVAVALTTAAALVCASGLPDHRRRVLLAVVLAVAVVVAASCWIGVAFHLVPQALPSSGLWRAASTLTYANATAAFLVIATLLATAALPVGAVRTAVVAVLALALVTTLSRAGAVGLVVAAAVLVAATRRTGRAHLASLLPAVPAVAVAAAALLPSLPVGATGHPWIAAGGLVAGAAVLAAGAALRPRHLVAGLAAAGVVAAALVLLVPAAREAATGIVATRLTPTSDVRSDLARVTVAQFRTAPWTGVGPGNLDLHYIDHTGVPVRAVFTHDEFLQTATETGLVGLALVVAALVALVVGGLRARTPGGAAAAAVVAGFAAHSAFDFLWHIPLLPLLLAVAVALLITRHPQREDVP